MTDSLFVNLIGDEKPRCQSEPKNKKSDILSLLLFKVFILNIDISPRNWTLYSTSLCIHRVYEYLQQMYNFENDF